MIIVQLSDPHIVARGKLLHCLIQGVAADAERVMREFDTARYLARAVAAVNELVPRPDLAVLTGDLVDHGAPEEYEHLRALLAPLSMPVFVIPGNHDAREPLRTAFHADGYLSADRHLHYAVEDYPLRLVALDTLVDDKHHGSLSLDDAAAFAEVVCRHPQIERILCGHLHRAIDRRFAGTVAGTAPGTAHQIRINLVSGARISFNFEPPGYQLHIWQDGSLVTHTALFGEWLEPLE